MKEPTFEQSLERLETIIDLLENPETPLEKSMEFFEEGTKLAALCDKKLKTAEQKIIDLGTILNGGVAE